MPALGFTMFCDVTSAVTEFMVNVLHSRPAIELQMLLRAWP
jgi:hypothetical protein